jgi:hypothetical protein
MPEREILLLRLAEFARRIQLNRRLRDLGWMACGMFGLLTLHEILKAVIGPAKVVTALGPLLVVACVAVLAVYGWRLARKVPLDRAASEADVRADLKDELKSAYWFVRNESPTPFVELLLRRAAQTAQRIDSREMFPVVFPSSLLTALAIAIAAVALAWISPRINYSTTHPSLEYARARGFSPERAELTERSELSAPGEQPARAAGYARSLSTRNGDDVWQQIEELTHRLDRSAERDAIQQAVKAQDAKRTMRLLEGLQRSGEAGQAALPEGEQMPAEVAQGIMARLKALLDEDAAPASEHEKATSDVSTQPAARVTQGAGGESEDQAQDSGPGRHSVGETALNTLLRAISRGGTGSRQAVRGEGEGWQERGRSNASGGAMGRRVGVSQAGAGSEDPATGNPAGDSPSDPVLGMRTMRLQTQLQRVHVKPSRGEDDNGTAESFYSATQSQDSTLSYQAVTGRQTTSKEEMRDAQQIPLAYRAAVKNYFLTVHSKEK